MTAEYWTQEVVQQSTDPVVENASQESLAAPVSLNATQESVALSEKEIQ